MREVLDKNIGRFRIIAITYDGPELQKVLPLAKEGRKHFIELIEDESNMFVGSAEDVAVGLILAKHLRRKLSLPLLDCEAHEEPGYGLPEFSIYYNQDARSFCGRWTYDNAPLTLDECGLFFALLPSTSPEYMQVKQTMEELLEKEERVAIAVLEHGLIF